MITVLNGDLFETNAGIICHQVNCKAVMGSGVALQVRQRYPNVYNKYVEYCRSNTDLLGTVLRVSTETNYVGEKEDALQVQMIYNLFAQENYGYDRKCYTSYDALQKCFHEIAKETNEEMIAMPYLMGCHRGGGDWGRVYKMIEDTFASRNVVLYRKAR